MSSVEATKKPCAEYTLLSREAASEQMATVPSWKLIEHDGMLKLELGFKSANFDTSLAFVNSVGGIANRLDHHPDIHVESFRNVRLVVYTYSLKGVTDLDFELARTIDAEVPR